MAPYATLLSWLVIQRYSKSCVLHLAWEWNTFSWVFLLALVVLMALLEAKEYYCVVPSAVTRLTKGNLVTGGSSNLVRISVNLSISDDFLPKGCGFTEQRWHHYPLASLGFSRSPSHRGSRRLSDLRDRRGASRYVGLGHRNGWLQ